jgi:hypothetical protein
MITERSGTRERENTINGKDEEICDIKKKADFEDPDF